MERHATLLLDVWREVCRHTRIEESVARVATILSRRLPAHALVVREVSPKGDVETLAVGVCRPGAAAGYGRTELGTDGVRPLLSWCLGRDVARLPERSADGSLRGLVPAELEGEVLALPLESHGGSGGALLVAAGPPRRFRAEHLELVAALREPFAVALENDSRLRELTHLREALEADKRSLLSRLGRHDISDSIVGAETGLRDVMEQVELVAASDAPVLVLGETGSGKEVVARAIHARSRRARGPFLRVNCGAIPTELVDSELFGHEKGSFTGALGQRKGWFERADGGTLFLDEVGELPAAAQVRLLRVLQDGMLERVGGERPLHVDVRIVAATHRDLQAMVAEGRFRQDLWYRIAVFPVRLPPLRERVSDIPALATHFSLRAAARLGMPALTPSAEDIGQLVGYAWPGNVRELAAVVERAAILGGGTRLEIGRALGTPPAPGPSKEGPRAVADGDAGPVLSLDEAVTRHIETALRRTRGRIEGPGGAAAALRINPHTLRARMRKLGIAWRRFRDGL